MNQHPASDQDAVPQDAPDHLSPEARAMMSLNPEDRAMAALTRPFFQYPVVERIQQRMNELLRHPRCDPTKTNERQRMQGLMVLGSTNAGKSQLLQDFLRQHPADENPGGEAIRMPVVYVEIPAMVNRVTFCDAVLKALQSPMTGGRRPEQASQVVDLLIEVGARMIILDEFQHIGRSGSQVKNGLLDFVKTLGTAAQVNVVVAGIPEARPLISSDPQLSSRTRLEVLPPMTLDLDYATLLISFERTLPLPQPSHLATTPDLAQLILALSEQTLGDVADLLILGAKTAIQEDLKQITPDLLRRLHTSGEWTLPSKRR